MECKPLGQKCYGSIPHLPGSRLGPSDKQANPGHVIIATEKKRDKHDQIIVSEKLDGSNVGVAKLGDGSLIPLTRAGYEAISSPYEQHKYWAVWTWENSERFDQLLQPNEWCVGEWCIQAHGTRYIFRKEPFFLFDLFHNKKRITRDEICQRNDIISKPFEMPHAYASENGDPISLENVKKWLDSESTYAGGKYGVHGAVDPIEGYVWRVERKGVVDFLVKYVRPDKVDGLYLPEVSTSITDKPIYNYWEDTAECIEHLRNVELKEEYEIRRQSSNNLERHVIRKRSHR
jgi:hypothetical protein